MPALKREGYTERAGRLLMMGVVQVENVLCDFASAQSKCHFSFLVIERTWYICRRLGKHSLA